MILIVGHHADPHVAAVIKTLEHRGDRFSILDFFSHSSDGLHHQATSNVTLEICGSRKTVNEFNSVWWRQKPRFIIPADSSVDLYNYFFVHREWNQLIDYLGIATNDLFSINDRAKNTAANNKCTQLQKAVDCGFAVPDSLISNDVDSIIDFVSKTDRKYVYKPFTPYMPPSGKITYTTEINLELLLDNRDTIRAAPGIYQEFVEKNYELRITVVGKEIFAARVDSHHSAKTEIDWRREIFADMYTEFFLDNGFHDKLLSLHSNLGLFYCAYDFIIDKDGKPVLLDVNPSGQWMWIEARLGFPISERIALALANSKG